FRLRNDYRQIDAVEQLRALLAFTQLREQCVGTNLELGSRDERDQTRAVEPRQTLTIVDRRLIQAVFAVGIGDRGDQSGWRNPPTVLVEQRFDRRLDQKDVA